MLLLVLACAAPADSAADYAWCIDNDRDGYGSDYLDTVYAPTAPPNYAPCDPNDCDDADSTVHPGAPGQTCGGPDVDCDGSMSDGC